MAYKVGDEVRFHTGSRITLTKVDYNYDEFEGKTDQGTTLKFPARFIKGHLKDEVQVTVADAVDDHVEAFEPVCPTIQTAHRIDSPLPLDSAERKTYPICSGVLDYFPAALAAVAHHSYKGNEKHNPGQKLHWSRDKSNDHLDAALRHIMERDLEGAAWRILAALQMQLELEGAPAPIGAVDGTD